MSDKKCSLENMDLEQNEIDPGKILDIDLWVNENLALGPHFLDDETPNSSEGANGQGLAPTQKQPPTGIQDSEAEKSKATEAKGESKVLPSFSVKPSKFKTLSFENLRKESQPPFGVGSPLANLSASLVPPLNVAQRSVVAKWRGNKATPVPSVKVPKWPPGHPDWIPVPGTGERTQGAAGGLQRPRTRGRGAARARSNRRAAQFRQRATDSRAAHAFATFFSSFSSGRR